MNTPQPPSQPQIVYISFSAEISPHTTESLLAVMSNCANQGVKTVYLLLSSPGGSVMNGLNLYNVLRGMPFELITHNVGNVDSIANAIFLAGSKRYACPHSTFMFHGVGFDVKGQFRLEEKLLRERLDNILTDHKRIGSIISERTKLDQKVVETLFTEAKDVQIPAGSNVISLVFQR